MAIKDEDKKPALSKNAEANNSSKTYNSPVVSVYGQKGGEQHRLKFYHLPTKRSISFPAFLTSFGDSYTSNWAQENVYGRMDPIPVFESTNRSVSIGFMVVPDSGTTAKTYMRRIQMLVQRLYPTYESVNPTGKKSNDFNILSTAPVWRIKFANILSSKPGANGSAARSGQLCYITSLEFNPDMEAGFIMSDNNIYPKKIEINLSINILHDHTVGFIDKKFQGGSSYPYRVTGQAAVPPAYRDTAPQNFKGGTPGPTGNAAKKAAEKKTLEPGNGEKKS